MEIRFRPIEAWPYPETRERRGPSTFSANYGAIIKGLTRELGYLEATAVIIGAGMTEADIRLDGLPRAYVRVSHPGIEVSFSSPVSERRLVYATDSCERWHHNIRSIALGLAALRAVDRYGITRHGEQYAGFRGLPAAGDSTDTVAEARAWLASAAGLASTAGISDAEIVRTAQRACHPDHGGSREQWDHCSVAVAVLRGQAAA